MMPLRILHVTPYYADAWAYGGIPRLAATLSRGLARRGHSVTVCTTDACDRSTRLSARGGLTPEGATIKVFPNLSNALAYHLQFFLPVGLHRFLERHARAFDIAHLHACRNVPGAIAAHHLHRAGVPYVLAPNGTAPRIERRRLAKRGFDVVAGERMLRNAARVIAVSGAEQRQLRALGVEAWRTSLVPNPVDLREFSEPIVRRRFRARFGIPDVPLVMYLGKLTPRKRVDVLVRAVAQLRRSGPMLVVAGNDMGSESTIRSLVRAHGLDAQTIFTGLLCGKDRLEALADADVVVYPSQDEIFGLVPLEALLAGTPVIVADDSGCGEVVRRVGGGLVTRLGDVRALADALRLVLDSPEPWRLRAVDAAARVRVMYGDEVVCAELDRLYCEILGAA